MNNLMRFMMYGKLMESGLELATDTAASNRGSGRGGGPVHPPKRVRLAKSSLLGRLAGREVADKDDNTMGYITYRERKGGSARNYFQ